jgi:hypothetical protein
LIAALVERNAVGARSTRIVQFAVSSPRVPSKAPIEIGDVSLWTQGGHSRARRNIRWCGRFIAQTGGGIRPDQLQCGRRLPEFSFERRKG